MKKAKYYYSMPLAVKQTEFITSNNVVIGFSGKEKHKFSVSRLTICGIYDDEENTLSFGVAKCSPEDQFVKAIGRKIAYDRALNNPICTVEVRNRNISEVYAEVACALDATHLRHTVDRFEFIA